jgi:uncharacterized protein (DUF2141 family)
MKKYLILAALLFLSAKYACGQCALEIEITGLKSNNGLIMLQLLNEKEEIISRAKGVILEKKSIIFIKDLKPGRYAFRYYHDENLSEKMETSLLGIPKEGYGISNNASGPFGNKPFREWLFEINQDKKVSVKTRYQQKN